MDGDVLILTDDNLYPVISSGHIIDAKELVNHFRVENNSLRFIEEGSSNFIYVNVKDGECFLGASLPEDNGAT